MSAWQAQDGLILLRCHLARDVLLFCGGGDGGSRLLFGLEDFISYELIDLTPLRERHGS